MVEAEEAEACPDVNILDTGDQRKPIESSNKEHEQYLGVDF
jgi:hypothetical protein